MSRSSLEWDDQFTKTLASARAKSGGLTGDLAKGAKVVLKEAVDLVPKESGALAKSGRINRTPLAASKGRAAVSITFSGPYARWIHEHLWFRHPNGGQAKYLEAAMLLKGREAINKAGENFWRRL